MKTIRTLGCLFGGVMIFFGLMPWLGMLTDWGTIDQATKSLASIISVVLIGFGILVIALASGLVAWISDKLE